MSMLNISPDCVFTKKKKDRFIFQMSAKSFWTAEHTSRIHQCIMTQCDNADRLGDVVHASLQTLGHHSLSLKDVQTKVRDLGYDPNGCINCDVVVRVTSRLHAEHFEGSRGASEIAKDLLETCIYLLTR